MVKLVSALALVEILLWPLLFSNIPRDDKISVSSGSELSDASFPPNEIAGIGKTRSGDDKFYGHADSGGLHVAIKICFLSTLTMSEIVDAVQSSF